jgi:GDP-L-fucose synthase
MPRKLMDGAKLAAMGWRAQIDIREGIGKAYDWYMKNVEQPGRAPAVT